MCQCWGYEVFILMLTSSFLTKSFTARKNYFLSVIFKSWRFSSLTFIPILSLLFPSFSFSFSYEFSFSFVSIFSIPFLSWTIQPWSHHMGQWKVAIHTSKLRRSCSGHDQSISAQPGWEGHLLRKAAGTGYPRSSRKKKASLNRVRRVSARKGEDCVWVSAHAKWSVYCMANGMFHCYEKSEPEPGRGCLCRAKAFHGMSELEWAQEGIHGGQRNLAKNNTGISCASFSSPSSKLNILHKYTTIWNAIKQHWYHWFHYQSAFKFHTIHVYLYVYVCVYNSMQFYSMHNFVYYYHNQDTQLLYHHEAVLCYYLTTALP